MAINPTGYPMPGAFMTEIDWSPLARMGEIIKQQRQEEEASRMIAQLYGMGEQQQLQPMMPVQRAPSRVSGPLPPPLANATPPINVRDLTPPPPATPAQRVAEGFAAFPGAGPAPPAASPTLAANEPSQLDTAQWPAGPVGAPAPQPMAYAPEQDIDRYARATSAIESGSPQGNYRAIGPETKYGRALGRYQVLTSNVPAWTEKYFGERLTPTEFLNNPKAQDAVYRGEFGRLAQKYGPEGAARAWFAGEGNMNNPNASDSYKTVAAYASDFNRNLGLPPEITAGGSRPTAQSEPPTQALAFDRAVDNLATPSAPAAASGLGAEQLAALYKNPLTRPVAQALLQKQLSPDVYDFKIEGDNIVRYNKRDGTYSVSKLPQKLMSVKEDERIYDPNTRTFIGGEGGDGSRYGKLPAGERWKDPSNKALGTEPIPGSQHAKIGDEIAARVGLAKSFISTLPEIRQRIDRGDVGISTDPEKLANHGKAMAGLGVPGETKRMMDAGAEALIRMLTGAGMNKDEAVQNAEQYRLRAKDDAFTIRSKMDALERHLFHIGGVLGQGRGGGNLLETPAASGGGKRISSQAEYNALPPGTQYIAPDGSTRTKR